MLAYLNYSCIIRHIQGLLAILSSIESLLVFGVSRSFVADASSKSSSSDAPSIAVSASDETSGDFRFPIKTLMDEEDLD